MTYDSTRLVLIGGAVIMLVTVSGVLRGDSARRAEAEVMRTLAEESQAALVFAEEIAAEATTAREVAEDESRRHLTSLAEARALQGRLEADAERELAVLQQRLDLLAVERVESGATFRLQLPEDLRAPFDAHEQIHAAELEASELAHEQTRQALFSVRAFSVRQDSTIASIMEQVLRTEEERDAERLAKLAAIAIGDAWKVSSDSFEAASNRGLLARLWDDAETYVGAVGVGYGLAMLAGG